MNNLKITPGPWTAEKEVDLLGFETGKLWIIMRGQPCAYGFDRIEDATAAAAVPELIAGCIAALESSSSRAGGLCKCGACDIIRAALRKAGVIE